MIVRHPKAIGISALLAVCLVLGMVWSPSAALKVANAQEGAPNSENPQRREDRKFKAPVPALPGLASPAPDESLPPPVDAADLPPVESPAPVSLAPPTSRTLDPDQDAEQFVAKTRKEAVDRIAALDKEAADLRAKLAKVEAASKRIKTAMGGLLDPVAQQVPQIVNGEPMLLPIPEGPKPPTAPADKPLNELPR